MKPFKVVGFIVVAIMIAVTPVTAKLMVTYQQEIIFVEQVQKNNIVISAENGAYEIKSAEVLMKIRRLIKQNARILYVDLGDSKRIVDVKTATDEPFTVSK